MKMPTLEQIRTNRNVLFWSLHAAGWAAYGITQYFGALLYEKPSSYARVIAVAAISGFILSMPMRYIYRRLVGSDVEGSAVEFLGAGDVLRGLALDALMQVAAVVDPPQFFQFFVGMGEEPGAVASNGVAEQD